MIATIMPTTEGTKYVSTMDAGAGVGAAGVAGALSITKAVSAYEPKYALEPPNIE
jgi:hypothetical protein